MSALLPEGDIGYHRSSVVVRSFEKPASAISSENRAKNIQPGHVYKDTRAIAPSSPSSEISSNDICTSSRMTVAA
jgi:hypothetical protein